MFKRMLNYLFGTKEDITNGSEALGLVAYQTGTDLMNDSEITLDLLLDGDPEVHQIRIVFPETMTAERFNYMNRRVYELFPNITFVTPERFQAEVSLQDTTASIM